MNIDEIINNRRSARNFTDKDVSEEQIKIIIQSASKAPSAKNRQPWKFYILNNFQKNHIADMLLEWDKNNKNQPVGNKMILIYKDLYKSKTKKIYYPKPDYISLGCAIENMSLQAINLGLGSCILCDTLYIEKEIDNYLKISNHEQICGFIVGYPIYDYPQKQKKKYEDLLLN